MGVTDGTHAIIVAIGQYPKLGPAWELSGLAAQAVAFTRWLVLDRGVPPENVQVFLSGGDTGAFTSLGLEERQIANASSTEIEQFLAELPRFWPAGKLLLLYWSGHGFIARDGGRRLITADAAPNLKENIDLPQMMELLRSERGGSFVRQIGIIDACARFFEELQSSTDLPPGGLPRGQQRSGVRQFFYLAASSGEYATNNSFGPIVLKLLRELPGDEWPPQERALRDRILDAFSAMQNAREADQQPAWLEYSDGLDSRATLGTPPTLPDLHIPALRSGLPLTQLRLLAQLASQCAALNSAEGRDQLCAEIRGDEPLANRAQSRDNAGLDLLRIIAGTIEQGRTGRLISAVVKLDSNSDEAFRFRQAASSVELIQGFWRRLQALRMTLARAKVLYKGARPARLDESEAGSLEEIVVRLVDSGEPLVEFLLRSAKERAQDPAHDDLAAWIEQRAEWQGPLTRIEARLSKEASGRSYLLVQIGLREGEYRVTRAWLWPAGGEGEELDELEGPGDIAEDISQLLDEAEGEGGNVFVEILVPEALLHLERGKLASKLKGQTLDPERSHPVALRLLDRMEAPIRDRSYLPGRWRNAAAKIRERIQTAPRAYWMADDDDSEGFRARYMKGETGELIGIPLSSHSEARSRIVGLICSGGLPFACWLRCSEVDLEEAQRSVKDLVDECSFEEMSDGLLRKRIANLRPLGDVLLLWDDPQRNPYDRKYTDVAQGG